MSSVATSCSQARGDASRLERPAVLSVPTGAREVEIVGQITRKMMSQERKLAGGRFPERGMPSCGDTQPERLL